MIYAVIHTSLMICIYLIFVADFVDNVRGDKSRHMVLKDQMCRVALNWSCNSSHLHIIPLIRFPAVYKNAIYHATSKYTLSGESTIPVYIFYIFMHVFYILTHFFYQQQCSEINKVPGCQNLYPRWSAESCTNCTTIIVTRRHKYEKTKTNMKHFSNECKAMIF